MKIDRLIGILSILLQKEKVTAPYLADKFEVSRRTINRDIEDENIKAIVESIRQDMTANIYQNLVDRGLTLWNAGNKTEAMDYFQASLTIKPDNPEALFYVGRLYQDAGDMDNANTMFDKVVNEFPDSPYVERARNARGY